MVQNSAKLTVPGGPSIACSTAKAVEWDAAWSGNLDPSGRAAVGVHLSSYKKQLLAERAKVDQEEVNNTIPPRIKANHPEFAIQT